MTSAILVVGGLGAWFLSEQRKLMIQTFELELEKSFSEQDKRFDERITSLEVLFTGNSGTTKIPLFVGGDWMHVDATGFSDKLAFIKNADNYEKTLEDFYVDMEAFAEKHSSNDADIYKMTLDNFFADMEIVGVIPNVKAADLYVRDEGMFVPFLGIDPPK